MATFYPAIPPAKSPNSEIKFRKALVDAPDLIVFHSVGWQSRRRGRPGDGEADFILVVPGHGLLVVEVKGGGVEIAGGSWFSTGSDGIRNGIKNPFEQAKDSKFALLGFLQNVKPQFATVPIFHGVCFPDIRIESGISIFGPRDLIIDKQDLQDPGKAVRRIAMHWKAWHHFSQGEIQGIIDLLAPTIAIRRALKDEVQDAENALISLTTQQIKVLHALGRNKRAFITGGAGTGKTLLALEKAKAATKRGLKTLLICYNGPLKEHLAAALNGSGVDVESFHSLATREAKKAGLTLPKNLDRNWFENRAVGDMLDAIDITRTKYDAIIVDEAQDFSAEWIDAVLFLTRDSNSLVYLFADSHQDLYSRGWRYLDSYAHFELTLNCRNTRPIAEKVNRIFMEDRGSNKTEGPEPLFIEVPRFAFVVREVTFLVDRILHSEGLSRRQIVVLSDSKKVLEELVSARTNGLPFSDSSAEGLHVETIQRFKGLDREVVILILTDYILERDFKRYAYVGISRARSVLYILGSAAIKKALAWK